MLQTFKRARFLMNNNLPDPRTRDLVTMHLWMRKHGWPADEFVDLFMRAHPDFGTDSDKDELLNYMGEQFEWVRHRDVGALERLAQRIATPKYRGADREKLHESISGMIEREHDRQPRQARG